MKVAKKSKQKQRTVLLFVGGVALLCLVGAIFFYLMHDYYSVESRVEKMKEYAKKDTENYSTVGWLRVQGTNIDYPVIYAPGYDFSSKTDDFLWTEANEDKLLNKVSISGHNILNLSANPLVANKNHKRFEQLMSFLYYDFVKENKYIQYTFQGKEYVYKIFSVSFADFDELDLFATKDYSKKELNKYIQQSLKESFFKFDIDVNSSDKIISLDTCTRMFGSNSNKQFRVDARLVRDNELKTNYSVSKKSNYKEILDIMEGGEENEKA